MTTIIRTKISWNIICSIAMAPLKMGGSQFIFYDNFKWPKFWVAYSLSASYSTYKVVNQAYDGGLQSVNGWDFADATVGWAGTASAAALILGASNPIGWAVIGIGAAGYGVFRAGQYIYENY